MRRLGTARMRTVAGFIGSCLLTGVAAGAPVPDGGTSEEFPLVLGARCDRAPGPGRVRCELDIRPRAGRTVRWADLQVLETPPFLQALRGRAGPGDASLREPTLWRFPFALAAKERGRGEVTLRGRAVVCTGDRCEGAQQITRVSVLVGAE